MSTIIVTTAADSGAGSLRQAIADAAAAPGFDEIFFAAGLANTTIRLTSGPLAIAAGNDVTIDASAGSGGAAGITISGDTNNNGVADTGDTSLFDIAAGATVTLDSLTLTNGFAHGADGAYNGGTAGGSVAGGIVNRGTLTLVDTTLSGNAAIGGNGSDGYYQGPGGAAAGGVLNYGTLTATGGAFAANDAAGGQGGSPVFGYAAAGGHAAGGILNLGGAVSLTGVTFDGTGSQVSGGYGGLSFFNGSGPGGQAAGGIVNFGTLTGSASGSGFTVLPGVYGGLTADLALTIGTGGTDGVNGFTGPQTVYGFGGDDILKGGGGADLLFGGDGNDTLSLEDGHAVAGETYDGGANADMLALYGNGTSDFDFRDSTVTSLETLAYASFFGGGATAHFLAGQFAFTALTLDNGVQVTTIDMGTATALDLTALAITGAGAGDRFEISGDGDSEAIAGSVIADALSGNGGNDTLTGGGGTDTLTGGAGNDTYVNPTGDTIVESAGGGTDTVRSDATIAALAGEVERLFLTGTAAVNGTGNGLANQINGNTANNLLAGQAGNDTIGGAAGGDTLQGGAGADLLTGGTQRDKYIPGVDSDADTLVFNILNNSTGVTRDVLDRVDFNGEDRIDLPTVPTAIAAAIAGGTLSTATFNTDLAAAVTAAALPAGQAVLFDPSAGDQDLAGTVYLIVDANGIAGYQANQDWVFQLENHAGTLDPTDFV